MTPSQMQPVTGCPPGSAFEELFERHYRKCMAFARHLIRSREEAEDLTQEAFLRAYRSFDHYDRRRPFDRWIFRIITNLFIDHLRRQRRVAFCSLDAALPDKEGNRLVVDLPAIGADPSEHLLREVMDERLVAALARLPQASRETIWMVDVEGMRYDEVAHKLGCALGTVRSRVHRTRLLLHKIMSEAA